MLARKALQEEGEELLSDNLLFTQRITQLITLVPDPTDCRVRHIYTCACAPGRTRLNDLSEY